MKNKIQKEMIIALKSGNTLKKNLLKTVLGELDRKGKNLTETEVDLIIRSMYNNTLSLRSEDSETESNILKEYLKESMSYEDIQASVRKCFKDLDLIKELKNFGSFMKKFVELNNGNTYDGKEVAAIIRKNLLNT